MKIAMLRSIGKQYGGSMESVLKRRRKKGYGGKYLRKREEARSEKREGVMDAESDSFRVLFDKIASVYFI